MLRLLTKHINKIIDARFIKQIVKGDRKAVIELYEISYSVLYATAIRYKNNKQDQITLVNDAFMKILKNIEKFKPETSYFSWIKTIIKNEIIDDYRKNKRHNELFQDGELNENAGLSVEENHAEFYDEHSLHQRLLNKLPPMTKLVFNLYAIDDFSYKEISEEFGISYETVKWHMKEARKKLKSLLEDAPPLMKEQFRFINMDDS